MSRTFNSYNIIFFGSESAGLRCLKFLSKQRNINILYLVTDNNGFSANGFKKIANKNGIELINESILSNKIKVLKKSKIKIDFILSVFSPYIINDEILNIANYGGFNLHPGKLPEYAGLNPTSWAIYNNEKYHEVTLHKMTNLIDGGDIVFSKRIKLSKNETALSLLSKSTSEGINLIKKFFIEISQKNIKSIKFKKQDLKKRNYYSNSSSISLLLDFNNSIEEIDRLFRASYLGPIKFPIGCPYIFINKNIVKLTNHKIKKCRHSKKIGDINLISSNQIEIACKDGLINADIIK